MRLGEILTKKGFISKEQLDEVLAKSPESEQMLGKLLVKAGHLKEEQLFQVLAEQLNIPFYPHLKNLDISPEVIKAVPVKFVQHYGIMPLELKDKVLTIAMSNPMDVWMSEEIKLHLGYQIQRVLSTRYEIEEMIHKYYSAVSGTVDTILAKTEKAEEKGAFFTKEESVEDIEKGAEEASVIKLVNQIFSEAIQMRATDIHIETYPNKLRLRYRVDGILYDIKIPENMHYILPAIVSRIKIMSRLNVVEHRVSQDGRVKVRLQDNTEVDLRVSIIPAFRGENVVIRILPAQWTFNIDDLGFMPEDFKKIEGIIQKPHGITFITGPTGSGKTTTLYACLSRLNKDSVKIITIEDPIEYEVASIMQMQVKPEVGFTFANALRSILRHDPDIIMVGEVRDLETAELAIRTALTGHLIFSTLHTNDAASGITRLLDIGIAPYLIASSINAFVSQRLVRTICPVCKEEKKNKELLPEYFRNMTVYYGKGCENCKFIGYKGRSAIFEILLIDDHIRELILNKASASEIKKKAKEVGFKALFDAGLEKVKAGITTPEEVMRVAGLEECGLFNNIGVSSSVAFGAEVKMEKRRSPRAAISIPIECTLLEQGKESIVSSGRSLNISASGILFEIENSLPFCAVVEIKLHIPGKEHDIICMGQVLRSELSKDGVNYRTAVCFIEIMEADVQVITGLVTRLPNKQP